MQVGRLWGTVVVVLALGVAGWAAPAAGAKIRKIPVKVKWTGFELVAETAMGKLSSPKPACARNRTIKLQMVGQPGYIDQQAAGPDGSFAFSGPMFTQPTLDSPLRAAVGRKVIGKGKRRRICKPDSAEMRIDMPPSEDAFVSYETGPEAFVGGASPGTGCTGSREYRLIRVNPDSTSDILDAGEIGNDPVTYPLAPPLPAGSYSLLLVPTALSTPAGNGDMEMLLCLGDYSDPVEVTEVASDVSVGIGGQTSLSASVNDEAGPCATSRTFTLYQVGESTETVLDADVTDEFTSAASLTNALAPGGYRVEVGPSMVPAEEIGDFVRCATGSKQFTVGTDTSSSITFVYTPLAGPENFVRFSGTLSSGIDACKGNRTVNLEYSEDGSSFSAEDLQDVVTTAANGNWSVDYQTVGQGYYRARVVSLRAVLVNNGFVSCGLPQSTATPVG